MAINKNFVIKNGVEVNTNLIVADSTLDMVGIGTTIPAFDLHVGRGVGGRGGIGATDLTVAGIATIGVANSTSGALSVTGISTFEGAIIANGGITARTALVQDLTEDRVVIAGGSGELEDSSGLTFDGTRLDVTHNVGIAGSIRIGGIATANSIHIANPAGIAGTEVISAGFQLKNIDSLDATTIATIEDAIKAGPNIFDDLEVTGFSTFVGFSTFESGFRVSGIGTFENDVDFYKSGFTTSVTWDQSANALTFTDAAAIRVGTGSDFSIMHDGSHTILRDSGTGDVKLYSSKVEIGNAAGTESGIIFTQDGSVDLYYDNTKTVETSPQGIIVSGVTTSNRVYVTGVSTLTSVGSNLIPDADGSRNIGAATSEWGDLFIDGTATIDTLTVDENAGITGNLTVTGNATVNGNVDLGNAATDSITPTGRFDAHIVPLTDNAVDLGASGVEFKDLYIDGTANIDALAADTAAIGDLTDNRVVIAGSSGELEDDANFTYDGSKLNIGAGTGATVYNNGNATFSGIVTAAQFEGGGIGVGIGSTGNGDWSNFAQGLVGYGFTYLSFVGSGVSMVRYNSSLGIATVVIEGGGGSAGAAGTWSAYSSSGIATTKSVGVGTVGMAVTALQGGVKGASTGIGASFQGLYISNGMMVVDNTLNDNHYIGTSFNGMMAGPVTVNGVITVDGNWVVV